MCLLGALVYAPSAQASIAHSESRTRSNIDEDWRFALGHATDKDADWNFATGYFSYLAKTGYGDGPANPLFDDRGWRELSLPHDWVPALGFAEDASYSHGFKTVGPGYPEHSVGWYRKTFDIPESDLGKRIRVEFNGIYRDAAVFVNGFFVGQEPSGYVSQSYDISEYLNYGGENVVVVRADASMEEGWYYEGAGIYRHAYLLKTNPLHVANTAPSSGRISTTAAALRSRSRRRS
ncbi:MAG: beta-galactosidase [Puniceicoccaceae bacterium 5H]|nr:MAG: beta-galactosidase [Puniceicoccaceae bacterium 5H]